MTDTSEGTAMTLRLNEDDAEALRRRAQVESRSMQEVAREAVREYVEGYSRGELLDRVLDEELLRYAGVEAARSVIYLTLSKLLHVAARAIGPEVGFAIRAGEVWARTAPRATAFGEDAYATREDKAAALLHSPAGNHGLVDGDERLALSGTIAVLAVNAARLRFTNDEAYDLIVEIASGQLDEVGKIADRFRADSEPRASG